MVNFVLYVFYHNKKYMFRKKYGEGRVQEKLTPNCSAGSSDEGILHKSVYRLELVSWCACLVLGKFS